MSKSLSPGYQAGNHWVICDRCGFAYRASEVKKTWDGYIVCEKDWEPRHPQDLVRGHTDKIRPSGPVRPEPSDTFVTEPSYVSTTGNPDYTVPSGTF